MPALRARVIPPRVPLLFLILYMLLPGSARAQSSTLTIPAIGQATAPIADPWQFHLGDDPAWASPAFDDSTWQPISAAVPWGAQTKYPNHFNTQGFAWYRRHITLPAVPAASEPLGIYLPRIRDAYQLYWNGTLIGSFGRLPPHPLVYVFVPHTFLLGPARSGVLAIRVWKGPPESFATGSEGGLMGLPLIGSATAIRLTKANYDFNWLHGRQFYFGFIFLYAATAVLAFLVWLNDRSQKLLFWIALYALSPLIRVFPELRTNIPYQLVLGVMQPLLASADVGLWFILVYLFGLDLNPRLRRITQALAVVILTASSLDGLITLTWNSPASLHANQVADIVLTAIVTLCQFWSLVLVVAIVATRRRFSLARWAVALFAFLLEAASATIIILQQGRRFTHFTFDEILEAPLFTVRGNSLPPMGLLAVAFLVALVAAIISSLRESLARQSALEREYLSAQELQRVLVPETLPELPGYAVTSSYLPAQQVGGDFFQLIPLSPKQPSGPHAGDALLVLGDVSGKGLKAAMTVALIVGTIRTLADFLSDPALILAGLNRRLAGRLDAGFVTCVLLRVSQDGTCTLTSAGHPAPILNGRELTVPPMIPLGILPDPNFESATFTLAPGDHLTLYTDGLLEARDPDGELFGIERVLSLAARAPSAADATHAAVAFGQDDDITVLTLTRLAHGTAASTTLNAPGLQTATGLR